jgi:hypothetical protein
MNEPSGQSSSVTGFSTVKTHGLPPGRKQFYAGSRSSWELKSSLANGSRHQTCCRLAVPHELPQLSIQWLFELKHDGFRSLAYLEDGECWLVSRHRNVYKSFETLREALAGLKAKDAILDGSALLPSRCFRISW